MEPPVAGRQRVDPRREGQGAEGDPAARAQGRRARTVPRLPRRAGRGRRVAGRDLRRAPAGDRLLALERACPIYIRAGKCLPVTGTEIVVRLRRPPIDLPGRAVPAQLLPPPNQPEIHHRDRGQRPGGERGRRGPDRDDRDPSPAARGDGRLRAGARRRDGRRRDALRARGLRRGGLAHRRSDPQGRHADPRLRARHLGAREGRTSASRRRAAGTIR